MLFTDGLFRETRLKQLSRASIWVVTERRASLWVVRFVLRDAARCFASSLASWSPKSAHMAVNSSQSFFSSVSMPPRTSTKPAIE